MKSQDICKIAGELVSGDRAKTHGDIHDHFKLVAGFWSVYLGVPIEPDQAAQMMSLFKIARTKSGTMNIDDYVDLAGYAGIAGELADA